MEKRRGGFALFGVSSPKFVGIIKLENIMN
jgi:hypothetical protein